MKQKPSPPLAYTLGSIGGLGFTFVIPPVLGGVIGYYLHAGTFWTLVLLVIGFAAGGIGAYRVFKRAFLDR
jgi:hypothetical protein